MGMCCGAHPTMADEQAHVRPGLGDDPLHAAAVAVELSGNVDGGRTKSAKSASGLSRSVSAAYQIRPSTSHVFPPSAIAAR